MRPNIHCDLINGPFGDPVLYADIMYERQALLFDLGDIRALSARKLLRVNHAFVSHAHMDHFADFDRLLRLLLGRDKTIRLYGPADFIERVESRLHGYTWNVLHRYSGNLVLDIYEVRGDGTQHNARFESRSGFRRQSMPQIALQSDVLAYCGVSSVRCAVLDHGIPCLGFALEEPVHVNVWKAALDEMGLAVGPWLRDLKQAIVDGMPETTPIRASRRRSELGEPVTLPLGELRHVARTVRGQKIGYIVDVRNHDENAARIERLVSSADVLFIECAFLEADVEHAVRKNHLTAWQAGILARRAKVGRIVPCHFSGRYADRGDALSAEADRAFRGSTA
jgi:ribonuclease Z